MHRSDGEVFVFTAYKAVRFCLPGDISESRKNKTLRLQLNYGGNILRLLQFSGAGEKWRTATLAGLDGRYADDARL